MVVLKLGFRYPQAKISYYLLTLDFLYFFNFEDTHGLIRVCLAKFTSWTTSNALSCLWFPTVFQNQHSMFDVARYRIFTAHSQEVLRVCLDVQRFTDNDNVSMKTTFPYERRKTTKKQTKILHAFILVVSEVINIFLGNTGISIFLVLKRIELCSSGYLSTWHL